MLLMLPRRPPRNAIMPSLLFTRARERQKQFKLLFYGTPCPVTTRELASNILRRAGSHCRPYVPNNRCQMRLTCMSTFRRAQKHAIIQQRVLWNEHTINKTNYYTIINNETVIINQVWNINACLKMQFRIVYLCRWEFILICISRFEYIQIIK